jgi:hypothetical protein
MPEVESQWSTKAFEWGCLFGSLFFFSVFLLGMFLGSGPNILGDRNGGLIGSILVAVLIPLASGPLCGLCCASLAIVLEFFIKTTWCKLRRKAPGSRLPDTNRRLVPASDKDVGKAEFTRRQDAPPDDSRIRDGSDGLCPPPHDGAGQ